MDSKRDSKRGPSRHSTTGGGKEERAVDDGEENATELEDMGNEEFLKEFFEEVTSIKSGMHQIRRNIRAIEDTYSQSLVTVGLEQGQSEEE